MKRRNNKINNDKQNSKEETKETIKNSSSSSPSSPSSPSPSSPSPSSPSSLKWWCLYFLFAILLSVSVGYFVNKYLQDNHVKHVQEMEAQYAKELEQWNTCQEKKEAGLLLQQQQQQQLEQQQQFEQQKALFQSQKEYEEYESVKEALKTSELLANDKKDSSSKNPNISCHRAQKLASRLLNGENYEEAIMLLEACLSQEPKNYNVMWTLGWSYYRNNDLTNAVKYMKESFDADADDDDDDADDENNRFRKNPHMLKTFAGVLAQKGDFCSAANYLLEEYNIVDTKEKEKEKNAQAARIIQSLDMLISASLNCGNLQMTTFALKEKCKWKDGDEQAYLDLSNFYFQTGDYKTGLDNYLNYYSNYKNVINDDKSLLNLYSSLETHATNLARLILKFKFMGKLHVLEESFLTHCDSFVDLDNNVTVIHRLQSLELIGKCLFKQNIVSLLKTKYHANVNAKNQLYWRPIHYAIWSGDLNLLSQLLEFKNIEMNIEETKISNGGGLTLLHLAAIANNPSAILFLRPMINNAGGDVSTIFDDFHRTALDVTCIIAGRNGTGGDYYSNVTKYLLSSSMMHSVSCGVDKSEDIHIIEQQKRQRAIKRIRQNNNNNNNNNNNYNSKDMYKYKDKLDCDFDVVDFRNFTISKFYNDYVSLNKPVLIRNAISLEESDSTLLSSSSNWRSIDGWEDKELSKRVSLDDFLLFSNSSSSSSKDGNDNFKNRNQSLYISQNLNNDLWNSFQFVKQLFSPSSSNLSSTLSKQKDSNNIFLNIYREKFQSIAKFQSSNFVDGQLFGSKQWKLFPSRAAFYSSMPLSLLSQQKYPYQLQCNQEEGDLLFIPKSFGFSFVIEQALISQNILTTNHIISLSNSFN